MSIGEMTHEQKMWNEIRDLKAKLDEWHSIFGHLSKDADEAGNIINEARWELEKERDMLREGLERIVDDNDCTDLEECKYMAELTLHRAGG